jgi:formate dehydrogenase
MTSTSSLQQKEKIGYRKFLLVTHPDPESGHPTKYVRDSIPEIKSYPGGTTTPTPKAISFKPGELLGDETGAFGIKSWLEGLGHQVVVTTDKEGPKSVFEKELVDADVVLSQPFYPVYILRNGSLSRRSLSCA